MNNGFNDSTRLSELTVGDLLQILKLRPGDSQPQEPAFRPGGRLVYGVKGIEELFGVSHKTAQYYKDHVIADAVRQNGRKIVVDVEYALKLFNEKTHA